ncbi:MAG TPA: 2-dehydropantoate 2-reductase [Steroidobacteraceae bacterium]|nr:2-dehydropantoate 2-reductase [Steroidobacteraceae bacterium]
MSSILMVGPGAIGATLTAWLCQDDRHQVTVAARTAFDSIETRTPRGVIRARPRVITDVQQAQPVEWILVATKAYDSDAASGWFSRAMGPHTRLAVIQNGVEHVQRFEKHFPRERIVPLMIDLPADRVAPGRTIQRGPAHLVVPAGEHGDAFLALFEHANFDLQATGDFTTAVWKKLCLNSGGAPCAVLMKPNAIFHHEPLAELMREIVRECVAVGRAEGARLEDSIPDEIVARTRRAPKDAGNSMYADRMAGRPMEYDARNGVIARLGRKHGIPAPMNALMAALLEAAQNS